MSDNIQVAIKVRPLIKREKDEQARIQWTVKENTISHIGQNGKTDTEYQFGKAQNFVLFFPKFSWG